MRVILCDSYKCKKIITDNEVATISVNVDGVVKSYDLCRECYNKFMTEFINKPEETIEIDEQACDKCESQAIEDTITDGAETEPANNTVKPEEVKPEEVKPEEVKPEEVKPEEVKPEEVKPEEVKPEEVKPVKSKVRKTYVRKKKSLLETQIESYGKETLLNEYVNNLCTAAELADKLGISKATLVAYFSRNGITKRNKEKNVDSSEKESHTLG